MRRVIIAVIGMVPVVSIIWGIVTNRLDAALMFLWDQIRSAPQQNFWPWVIAGGIIVILIIGITLYIATLRQTLARTYKILDLDRAVLQMLPDCHTPDEYKRLLVEILRHITKVFGEQVERGAILLPDGADPSSLICWEHYLMPDDGIRSKRIYVGNDPQKQRDKGGVASAAFRNVRIMVCHKENGHWTYDGEAQPTDLVQGAHPYVSFVCVPIMGSNSGTNAPTCIGILHLESRKKDSFDSDEIKLVLEDLARCVATTLSSSKRHP